MLIRWWKYGRSWVIMHFLKQIKTFFTFLYLCMTLVSWRKRYKTSASPLILSYKWCSFFFSCSFLVSLLTVISLRMKLQAAIFNVMYNFPRMSVKEMCADMLKGVLIIHAKSDIWWPAWSVILLKKGKRSIVSPWETPSKNPKHCLLCSLKEVWLLN